MRHPVERFRRLLLGPNKPFWRRKARIAKEQLVRSSSTEQLLDHLKPMEGKNAGTDQSAATGELLQHLEQAKREITGTGLEL